MAQRLIEIHNVMKPTASVYLHCDWYAGHYLKLVLDAIYGKNNFRNEVVWFYNDSPGRPKSYWPRKHDMIYYYPKGKTWTFNGDSVRIPILEASIQRYEYTRTLGGKQYIGGDSANKGKIPEDVWPIPVVKRNSEESLGYPTQKPLALLERIVRASSNPHDLILDPFCGCGTAIHAAENLNRQWIGIDISRVSAELMRERILNNFTAAISPSDIKMTGIPMNSKEARRLARENWSEFEKWVCARMGSNRMGKRKRPGDKGPDGGIDGEILLPVVRGGRVSEESVVVQVKGGNVGADSVKALSETVRRVEAIAGVLVCFEDQMGTVENQRSRETWSDDYNAYPVIQGFSIERMLDNERPDLPPMLGKRRGGRIVA